VEQILDALEETEINLKRHKHQHEEDDDDGIEAKIITTM